MQSGDRYAEIGTTGVVCAAGAALTSIGIWFDGGIASKGIAARCTLLFLGIGLAAAAYQRWPRVARAIFALTAVAAAWHALSNASLMAVTPLAAALGGLMVDHARRKTGQVVQTWLLVVSATTATAVAIAVARITASAGLADSWWILALAALGLVGVCAVITDVSALSGHGWALTSVALVLIAGGAIHRVALEQLKAAVGLAEPPPLTEPLGAALLLVVAAAAITVTIRRMRTETMWSDILGASGRSFLLIDDDGYVESASGSTERLTGYTTTELIGRHVRTLVGGQIDRGHHEELMAGFRSMGGNRDMAGRPIPLRRKDGSDQDVNVQLVSVDSPAGPRVAVVISDATPEAQALADAANKSGLLESSIEQLRIQATTDGLTGLLNLHGCRGALDHLVAFGGCTLLFVDVDKFKAINDGMSHEAGDTVLCVVGERLVAAARSASDFVARIGGDEFIVALAGPSEPEMVEGAAMRISRAIADQPIQVSGRAVRVTASVGATGSAGPTSATTMRQADLALHHAKREGHGAYAVYDESMGNEATAHLAAI